MEHSQSLFPESVQPPFMMQFGQFGQMVAEVSAEQPAVRSVCLFAALISQYLLIQTTTLPSCSSSAGE